MSESTRTGVAGGVDQVARELAPEIVRETLKQLFPDGLPGDTDEFLSVKEVCAKLKLSKTSVYRLIGEGKLPRPTQFGASSRWSAREINAVILESLAARGAS